MSRHIITIEANSYPELRQEIARLAAEHGLVEALAKAAVSQTATQAASAPATGDTPDQDAGKAAKADETAGKGKGSGKGKAAEKPAEKPELAEKAEPATDDSAAAPDEDQQPARVVDQDMARAQLMAYVKEKGQVKGKELIESFGATKLSEVPKDKLADLFVAAGGEL